MKRTLQRHRLTCLVGGGTVAVAVLLLTRGFAADKAPPPKPPIAPPGGIAKKFDRPKSLIEAPAKQLLANRTLVANLPSADKFVNPKVEPGKVRWHKTFANACAAAKKSGKPVLLFEMMGKLDERFC